MTNYIVFDFETTGFNAQKDRVTQMSAGRVVNGEIAEFFNQYIKLDIPVPEKITELTGITNALLDEKGIEEKDAFEQLYSFIGDRLLLVGHNSIKFDRVWLNHYLQKHGFSAPNNYRHVDTAVLFKARELGMKRDKTEQFFDFGMRVMNTYAKDVLFNLGHCCKTLQIDVSDCTAHRSDSDIIMTHRVLQYFYKLKLEEEKHARND